MADKPVKRLITKNEGDAEWTELAAFWQQSSGSITGTFSRDVTAGTRVVLVDAQRPASGPDRTERPAARPR
jgi:hypothetical protein